MIFNKEMLTGNKTLTDSSEATQYLDPGTTDRIVQLPPVAVSNPPFHIINTGMYLLTIQKPDGTKVFDLEPDDSVRLISDGTFWVIDTHNKNVVPITGQIYSFGGDLGGANQFFRPNGQFDTGNAGTTVDGQGTFHVIQVAGTIDEVAYHLGAETQTETLEIFHNGILARTISVNGAGDQANGGGTTQLRPPLVVGVTDRIAVRSQSATNTCMFQFRVRNTTEGYLCQFGGDITTNGAYYGVAENAQTGKGGLVAGADNIVTLYAPPGGGNLTHISYAIQNANTSDQLEIIISGGLAETVTLTNGVLVGSVLVGQETLSTSSFINGDTLAIRNQDQSTGDAVISLLSDIPGHLIHYKGNPSARGYWEAWHENAGDGGGDIAAARTKGITQRRGQAILTWYASSTPTAGYVVVRKHQRRTSTAIVDPTAGVSGTTVVPLSYEPGDRVQVGTVDGVGGNTSIAIIIQ